MKTTNLAVAVSQSELRPRSLAECEAVIDGAIETFRDVAMALWEIQHRELWKESGHLTFSAYCQARYGWAKTYGYDMAQCGKYLSELGDQNSAMAENLSNERQVRELVKVPPMKRIKVLEKAMENGGTAKAIREAAKTVKKPSKAPPAPEPAKVVNLEPEEPPHIRTADEELGDGIDPEFRAKVESRFHHWMDHYSVEELPQVRKILRPLVARD